MSDTPETDAFREVVFAQYKEGELTGDGMRNILAALRDIETLERERECECKCDVDWPEEYYELRQRLERERDKAREWVKELIHENETLYRRLESVHEAYRLSGAFREPKAENEKPKQQ